MPSLIDVLRQDHSHMTRLLDALERQIVAFGDGGTLDFEITDAILDYCRNYPDGHHHPREDLIFDRLKERDPKAAETLGNLRLEHERLARLREDFAASLEAVAQDTPMERNDLTSAATAFLKAYRLHILIEEKDFFPAALACLSVEDWQELQARAGKAKDLFFNGEGVARYKALYRDVMRWEEALPGQA